MKSIQQILEQERIIASFNGVTLRADDDDMTYTHNDYNGGHTVAILGWKRIGKDGYDFIGRVEEIPAHKTTKLVSLTGGFEKNDNPGSAAKREFREEAGIDAPVTEFKSLGVVYPYKGATTTVYLFAVDCKSYQIQDTRGDGSTIEKDGFCKWISEAELTESTDPLLHSLYLRWTRRL